MKSEKTMTKKERKEFNKRRRTFWDINPITRRENKNKWKERKRHEKERYDRETV